MNGDIYTDEKFISILEIRLDPFIQEGVYPAGDCNLSEAD